ncbi:MAG: type I glyceraldehyde-3-phosphate dehydrogenase [Clostridia bacterium]|jgi:glyceraldehyde 3-phosphate dehydrogenase|nr:type I glyceraldehyde-3-phosphate dehydrogenase [Clostridia bacterium]
MAKIAINGFGRIGRNAFKIAMERGMDVVAINDLTDTKTLAHLLKYDSCFGKFNADIEAKENSIVVNGKEVKVSAIRNPEELPWAENNVDIVLECTGFFRKKEDAEKHITAGAKRVIISAPGKGTKSIVMGVNENTYDPEVDFVLDNASCTTNCLAPVAKVLNDEFGIVKGLMNTIHSYTNDQKILDGPHSDLRRARAAAESIIPTTTGAAIAVGKVIPELAGKLDGFAMRVPTPTVSVVDLTIETSKEVTVEMVNEALKKAADEKVLGYSDEPLVSIDYRKDSRSSIFDSLSTKVIDGNMVKVVSWYDNEWGYSNRIVDLAEYISNK